MATSNTKAVFHTVLGKTVVGVYDEGVREFAGLVVVLVFHDGSGLAFGTGNGSHWTVPADEVTRRVETRKAELFQLGRNLRDIMVV